MGTVALVEELAPLPARLDGWEGRLHAVIEDARRRPYVLGEHDCFRVTCRVVEALTGVDRWPLFAGYRTPREAMRVLALHGSTFEAAFDWFFGVNRVQPAHARRGDLCAYQTEDGQKHLGVCLGISSALLEPKGLLFVPTLDARCAWKVG